LRPNSKEWLATLEVWNPAQAAITRLAIEGAGGLVDICSSCGAMPSAEYINPTLLPPNNIRLCDNCLRIRQTVRGEPWQPSDGRG
jgi:hypothetical protein